MGRAFERLSPSFRKRLEGLNAIHTTTNPIMREIRDNGDLAVLRRPISKSVHPVVTVHPVTKQKALFVNSSYTQSIVGWDDEESGQYHLKSRGRLSLSKADSYDEITCSNSFSTLSTAAKTSHVVSATSLGQSSCGIRE